jgi:hypothetical protein
MPARCWLASSVRIVFFCSPMSIASISTAGGHGPDLLAAGPNDLDLAQFEPGSMRPKVEAAIDFVRRTGNSAAIGCLDAAPAPLAGTAGTSVALAQVGLR